MRVQGSLTMGDGFAAVRRASRAVTQLYDLALAPVAMRATQFTMLNVIDQAGELAQCDFARQYAFSVETLSRRFAALRKKGLVAIRLGPRCERIYSLTDKGRAALEGARPYWQNAQARLRHSLGEADWLDFVIVCEKAVRAAREAEELRTCNRQSISNFELPSQNRYDVKSSAA
ncbi:MAG: hypothetical protein JOZ14_10630 [Acidobacteria bacterium]|nr:hypothetical protein [Acidobacteriota bacterium]